MHLIILIHKPFQNVTATPFQNVTATALTVLCFERSVVLDGNAFTELNHKLVKLLDLLWAAETLAKNEVDVSIFSVTYDVSVVVLEL